MKKTKNLTTARALRQKIGKRLLRKQMRKASRNL